MDVLVYEDADVGRLDPLATARPACDLTIGGSTLVDVLGHFGPVRRCLRPPLARHVAALADSRKALWGGSTATVPAARPVSSHGASLLVVNARVVPSRDTLVTLRSLVERGRRIVVRQGRAIAAATEAAAAGFG